jgi:hypothetical protein
MGGPRINGTENGFLLIRLRSSRRLVFNATLPPGRLNGLAAGVDYRMRVAGVLRVIRRGYREGVQEDGGEIAGGCCGLGERTGER